LADYRYQSRTFVLFSGKKNILKFKKGSITPRDVSYTADFVISWDIKLLDKLFSIPGGGYSKTPFVAAEKSGHFFSIIDVKGSFAGKNNTSAITFPLKQKWMMQKYDIYVQKIIPISTVKGQGRGLFVDTFTPVKYLLTPTGKERTIHYKPVFINQYLKEHGI